MIKIKNSIMLAYPFIGINYKALLASKKKNHSNVVKRGQVGVKRPLPPPKKRQQKSPNNKTLGGENPHSFDQDA
jgi:hypothetical protein